MRVNPVRGEATCQIGAGLFKLSLTTSELAVISGSIGCEDLSTLYRRLLGGELQAMLVALPLMVDEATWEGKPIPKIEAAGLAVDAYTLADAPAVMEAVQEILSTLAKIDLGADDDEGNLASAPE